MAHLLKLLIEKILDLLDTIYRCPIAVGSSVGSSAGVHSHLFSREHDSMHRDAMLGKVGGDAVAVKPLHSIILSQTLNPERKSGVGRGRKYGVSCTRYVEGGCKMPPSLTNSNQAASGFSPRRSVCMCSGHSL